MAIRKGSKVRKKKKGGKWIQKANEAMRAKGTLGSFGKATASKIAAGKAKGGKAAKKAQFAENMKKLARRRKRKGSKRRRMPRKS